MRRDTVATREYAGMRQYDGVMDNTQHTDIAGDPILRDYLALDRTILANERTLLAYIRTSLALIALGAAALHIYESVWLIALGGVALVAGIITAALGGARFNTIRRRLANVLPPR